ncbi:DUF6233 domain-containing protein [Streptomyces sp. ALB3]|uniref:DUF6233 domain-containing protein n=1 Tax=Streptomyces sp. ALB3 TaxID=3374278 RepID=UPI0037B207E0
MPLPTTRSGKEGRHGREQIPKEAQVGGPETLTQRPPGRCPSSTALLHRGGCATYPDQVGLISREDAMVALAEPDIEPCEVCRPDTRLMG